MDDNDYVVEDSSFWYDGLAYRRQGTKHGTMSKKIRKGMMMLTAVMAMMLMVFWDQM